MSRPLPVLITAEEIERRVAGLAEQIRPHYRGQPVTIVGVLAGSLMFLADLVRRLDVPLRIGLIQASSYQGTQSGKLSVGREMQGDVRGRHVLLLDDILDTGQTLRHLIGRVLELEPLSLKVAVLLRKKGRQRFEVGVDFVGFEIPDEFVVGYGLDYNDEYRHLPHVAVLPAEMCAATTANPTELAREQQNWILGCLESTAFKKFRKSRKADVSFSDACGWWGITENARGSQIDELLAGFVDKLIEVGQMISAGQPPSGDGRVGWGGGLRLGTGVNKFLEEKIQRHLRLIRER